MNWRALSERPLDDITVERAVAGELRSDDLRIHPDTLRSQAEVAAAHGNPQLAANLLRAAELTALGDDKLLTIYEALRPHRSTREEFDVIAQDLDERGAGTTAAMIREAADAYETRGLLAR